MNLLGMPKVLAEVTSPVNGKIRVLKSLGLGVHIQVQNLTQSGGVVNSVWRKALREVRKLNPDKIKRCLVLGLGGGGSAMLAKDLWPGVGVTGVDVDPLMVELGKKYLGLKGVEVVIADAGDFIQSAVKNSDKYDLVLVDTYLGDAFPEKFERESFLVRVKKLLSQDGVAVFNRLYWGEKRPQAMRFAARLERVFPKVKYVFPEANLVLVCYN